MPNSHYWLSEHEELIDYVFRIVNNAYLDRNIVDFSVKTLKKFIVLVESGLDIITAFEDAVGEFGFSGKKDSELNLVKIKTIWKNLCNEKILPDMGISERLPDRVVFASNRKSEAHLRYERKGSWYKDNKPKSHEGDNLWHVYSEAWRPFGTYGSESEAKERLKQMETFKHINSDITKPQLTNMPQDVKDYSVVESTKGPKFLRRHPIDLQPQYVNDKNNWDAVEASIEEQSDSANSVPYHTKRRIEMNSRRPKMAKLKTTATTNSEVILKFINNNFPKDKLPTWGTPNLKINKERNGWSLMNYSTPILYRDNHGELIFNKDRYSVTISKIQNEIKSILKSEGLKAIEEGEDFIRGWVNPRNKSNRSITRPPEPTRPDSVYTTDRDNVVEGSGFSNNEGISPTVEGKTTRRSDTMNPFSSPYSKHLEKDSTRRDPKMISHKAAEGKDIHSVISTITESLVTLWEYTETLNAESKQLGLIEANTKNFLSLINGGINNALKKARKLKPAKVEETTEVKTESSKNTFEESLKEYSDKDLLTAYNSQIKQLKNPDKDPEAMKRCVELIEAEKERRGLL